MIEGGSPPPNGRDLGKRTRGMLRLRVVRESMARGNGESITANEMTSSETNQHPAFVKYHTVEVRMSPHA